jgi:hypothetical protein
MKKQTKTTRASNAVNQAILEITSHLEQAKFDEDGYRIHDPSLFKSGQLFEPWLPLKGMAKQKLTQLLAQEYARECRWAYDFQKDFLSIIKALQGGESERFRADWPTFLAGEIIGTFFPCHPLFGLKTSEVRESLAPSPAAEIFPLSEAAHMFSNNAISILSGLQRDYWLVVDWRKGPEAIERSLAAWIRENAPDNLPTLRGRNNAIDRFHELAAYRAKRAGLDHVEFSVLVGRKGGDAIYSDQPQFLRAARATARRIKRFDSDCRRLIAAHRKKNK